MRILLVDDDPGTRNIIRRVLARDFQCSIAEASNGLEALAALESDRFALVVLDLQMPVMDGLETLEAIRTSSAHAGVPVVMLTGEASERAVRTAVSLGISAYITKPIDPGRLSARFAAVLEAAQRQGPRDADPAARPTGRTLDPERPILVVDGDADFRHFVSASLGGRVRVVEAETGSQALHALLNPAGHGAPQLLLIGPSTGVLSGALLVKKVRSLALAPPPLLVGAYPRSHVDEVRQAGVYDAVLARTFVPETFLEQFERLARPAGALQEFLRGNPQFRVEIITATAQAFGLMLGTEVEPVAGSSLPEAAQVVRGRIRLVSTEPPLHLQFCFEALDAVAREIAARRKGIAAPDVAESDAIEAVAELTSIVAGRLQNRLAEHGITTQVEAPAVEVTAAAGTDASPQPFAQCFRTGPDGETRFRLTLEELAGGA